MATTKQILAQIRRLGPMARGSVVENQIRCGKANCKCAQGEPHQAFYFSRRLAGKTKMDHLRPDQVARMRQWRRNYDRLLALVEELTGALLAELREEKRQ